MNATVHAFSPKPIFWGFALSILYGVLTSAGLWVLGHASATSPYAAAYFVEFNSAVSGGLVFATALTVYFTQEYVPEVIKDTFTKEELIQTEYYEIEKEFFSRRSDIIFSASFAFVALVIFLGAGFPFYGLPEVFLVSAGCLQYAAGVYIGRRIFYIARMFQAVDCVHIKTDMFSTDKLSTVPSYVNYISTLTAVAVYVGVVSYYDANFQYDSSVGISMKIFMLFPAIIAVPVLIFSYFPRLVIKMCTRDL